MLADRGRPRRRAFWRRTGAGKSGQARPRRPTRPGPSALRCCSPIGIDRRCGSRSSSAAPLPWFTRPRAFQGPSSSSPTRATTDISCCCSTPPASPRWRAARSRGCTMRSCARCSGVRSGTRCAATAWRRNVSFASPSASCPARRDEQIVPVILGRLDRAVGAYLLPAARGRTPDRGRARPVGGRGATRRAPTVCARRTSTRSSVLRHPLTASRASRDCCLPTPWRASRSGCDPLGHRHPPARAGAPSAGALYAAQERRDTTADGRRRAFVAAAGGQARRSSRNISGAGSPTRRSTRLGIGSLWPFNALEQDSLSFPYVGPALDSLPFIQTHRRIFFSRPGSRRSCAGRRGIGAGVVRDYLKENPRLPVDLRRKVLQHMDELERTVRIREGPTGGLARLSRSGVRGQSNQCSRCRSHRSPTTASTASGGSGGATTRSSSPFSSSPSRRWTSSSLPRGSTTSTSRPRRPRPSPRWRHRAAGPRASPGAARPPEESSPRGA